MSTKFPAQAILVLLGLSVGPLSVAQAQTQTQTQTEARIGPVYEEVETGDEIVVLAGRIRGAVETDQPPVATFDEAEIAALGAGSLQDLLRAIAPQTGSGRGRGDGEPVVLLNGVRVSGFREMRNFPPEAIRKVEVLPEEVALKYGFRANQRVVNFILKDDFHKVTVDAETRFPDRGGFAEHELEASLASMGKGARLNATAKLTGSSPLTEGERGIAQPAVTGTVVAGDPDPARYRTLIDDARSAAVNLSWARALAEGTTLSLNGNVEMKRAKGLFGLDAVSLIDSDSASFYRTTLQDGPLARTADTLTAQASAAYNRPVGAWALALTADYAHVRTETQTGRRRDLSALQALVDSGDLAANGPLPMLAPRPMDRALSNSDKVVSLATLSGQPFRLPAGPASLTVKAGFAYSALASENSRNPDTPTHLKRGDASSGFSLDLPLTSRREGVGSGIGDLSLNINADVNHLSDFGTLWGYGAGLTYSPARKLTLQASYIASEAAPGLTDLGAPFLVTSGVSLYDFVRGETVLAAVTSGGNRNLARERQRDIKLAANWELPWLQNSNLIAEYFRNRSYDTSNAFPLLTPAIEAAFPERFIRDANGRLISIDQRPVTFAKESGERLRYGLNIGGAFGKADPNARPSAFAGLRRAAGGGIRGSGGSGDGRGRWNLAIYHTIRFSETAEVTQGGPVLNLLEGDALSGSGVARHAIEMEGGAFYRGFGLRMNASYVGGTHINGSGLPGSTRIDFAPYARMDLRLFADLGRMDSLTRSTPFLKGSRLGLRVENLFDGQQRVRDANGAVPLRYQPGFLDPRGRVIELEFRKQF